MAQKEKNETIEKIKAIVEKAFKKHYLQESYGSLSTTHEYKLNVLFTTDRINNVGYAITYGSYGVIVEFVVSDSGIFQASSKGDLLEHTYEVECWLAFKNEIKEQCYKLVD